MSDEEDKEFQADLAWLRRQRKATEDIAKYVRIGIITTVLSGVLFLLWEGFKLAVQR